MAFWVVLGQTLANKLQTTLFLCIRCFCCCTQTNQPNHLPTSGLDCLEMVLGGSGATAGSFRWMFYGCMWFWKGSTEPLCASRRSCEEEDLVILGSSCMVPGISKWF